MKATTVPTKAQGTVSRARSLTLTFTIVCALVFAADAQAAEPIKHKPKPATTTPLSYENVVSYFKESGLPTK